MKLLSQINRLEQMNQLIRLESTGTPKQFACKLNISESTLYELLKLAKELGANIEFNRSRQSYIYTSPTTFVTGYINLD